MVRKEQADKRYTRSRFMATGSIHKIQIFGLQQDAFDRAILSHLISPTRYFPAPVLLHAGNHDPSTMLTQQSGRPTAH